MSSYQRPDDRAEAAVHLLAHYGYGGPKGGSFTTRLIDLWAAADPGNRAALARAFPAMGDMIETLGRPGGVDRLNAFLLLDHNARRHFDPRIPTHD